MAASPPSQNPGEKTVKFVVFVASIGLGALMACSSSTPSLSSESDESSVHCTEPTNPYEEGTGHYAGYEWAERNGSLTCGGSSESFIEGCEEYQTQESEFENCEAQQRK
jgi:hypothetical protein